MSNNSRHIMSFENGTAIQNALNDGVIAHKYVAYDESASTIDWDSKTINYAAMPLTFVIISGGTIVWKTSKSTTQIKTIEYSINGSEWSDITSNVSGVQIPVVTGDRVSFRGRNDIYGSSDTSYNSFSGTTAQFDLKGNIMSLIVKTGYENRNTFAYQTNVFVGLFKGCTGLKDASNLILPVTAITQASYHSMFQGCTSLIKAPELPATTLSNSCYYMMFDGCSSLTVAPALPATTLGNNFSYGYMFQGCTSLIKAPELPATTLTDRCYYGMFYRCTNLNYVKCLATDISANNCVIDWLKIVSASGTFVKNPNMSSWTRGASGIPSNWTVQDA